MGTESQTDDRLDLLPDFADHLAAVSNRGKPPETMSDYWATFAEQFAASDHSASVSLSTLSTAWRMTLVLLVQQNEPTAQSTGPDYIRSATGSSKIVFYLTVYRLQRAGTCRRLRRVPAVRDNADNREEAWTERGHPAMH